MSNFEKALEFVLSHEGGYSNDPNDPGGETNFGISKRAYPSEDIKAMTRDRAETIYRRDYWDFEKCELLPGPIALVVFDCAVNQGQPTAGFLLQEAIGLPREQQDGVIGAVTIAEARKADQGKLLEKLVSLRCHRYATAKNAPIYSKGWFRRAVACLIAAKETAWQ